jgi:hypothetical protein
MSEYLVCLVQDTLTATLVEIREHASSQALELATSQAEVTSLRGETTSLQRDLQDRSTELQETHCLLVIAMCTQLCMAEFGDGKSC